MDKVEIENSRKLLKPSFDSPVSQKITVEQIFQTDKGNAIIRKCCWESVKGRSVNVKELVFVQEKDNKAFKVFKNFVSFPNNPEKMLLNPENMNEENPTRNIRKRSKRIRPLLLPQPPVTKPFDETKQLTAKFLKVAALFLIPFAIIYIILNSDFYIQDIFVSDQLQVQNISEALDDKIYGQDEAVGRIKNSFKDNLDRSVLVFTGGIGVGKTYAANIISTSSQWRSNIHKIISPQFKNPYHETKILKTLSRFNHNLIVIDNLEVGDELAVIQFVKKLLTLDRKILIILIFNTPHLSFDLTQQFNVDLISQDISNAFKAFDISHTLVVFKPLDKDIVRKCIRYAMAKRGLMINQHNIEYILQNVNHKYSGCKGVYSKVALLR